RSSGSVRMMPSLAHPGRSCASLTGQTQLDAALVAARSLKVAVLAARTVAVAYGRWRSLWLLHLNAARDDPHQPLMFTGSNRISSSGHGRSDRFRLDQLPWPVLAERRRTMVNCNPNCNLAHG